MFSMIPYKYKVPAEIQHKQLHISDGSISKVLNNTMYTKQATWDFRELFLMQAGKLVEKSLHRHQSHFSIKSPAAGGGRHWLLYSKEQNKGFYSMEHCPGKYNN